jgi:hypothetical protein
VKQTRVETQHGKDSFARICHHGERGDSLFVDIPFGLFRILLSRVEEFKEAFNDRVQVEKEGISFDTLAERN